ncbi:MAG: NADH-quinone oxidoreductase subunit L [Thermoleophilia bacterium]
MGAVLVAIFGVPFLVCVLLLVGGAVVSRRGGPAWERWKSLAGWISAGGALIALGLAVLALLAFRADGEIALRAVWFHVGDLEVPFSLRVDGLQAVMAVVVAGVAFLVHLFSIGYMEGDRDVSTYFAELSLFTAAMLLLVLSANFFVLYVAWELVGASSYLLISYYFERPAAAAAGKKAFLTTRVGDLGLLVALFAIVGQTGSFDYDTVFAWAADPGFTGAWAVAVPLLVFAGAVGKSAQFPLHVWLPDAMEGPTPVSALIHAATMVAAGVYLVARSYPLFEAAPAALDVVMYIGAFTALMAATIAVTQRDIKKVLAYSTISQLGFMMTALGAGAPEAGIFHLFTHAWFKALLFLGAGSVIHATGRQLVGDLGGLARRMPLTAWTFAAGGLALAGIPPFAGFWSKEEILASLVAHHPVLLGVLLLAGLLTAFYIARLFFLVFLGAESAGPGPEPQHGPLSAHGGPDAAGAHESGRRMGIPLLLLAAASVVAGFAGAGFLGQPLQGFLSLGEGAAAEPHTVPLWLTVAAVTAGLLGVGGAWFGYGRPAARTRAEGGALGFDAWLENSLGGAYSFVARGYRLDDAYAFLLVRPFLVVGRFLWRSVDGFAIDGALDGLASLVPKVGGLVTRVQTGEVRDYLAAMAVGAILVVALVLGLFS